MNEGLLEIKRLVNQRNYEEALNLSYTLETEDIVNQCEIFRLRAEICAKMENYIDAVANLRKVIEMGKAIVSDYFLAANWAQHSEDYDSALNWFDVVLGEEEISQNTWFSSSVPFYKAYVNMQLGKYNEALQLLASTAESDLENRLPLPLVGLISRSQLKDEILRRQNLKYDS